MWWTHLAGESMRKRTFCIKCIQFVFPENYEYEAAMCIECVNDQTRWHCENCAKPIGIKEHVELQRRHLCDECANIRNRPYG